MVETTPKRRKEERTVLYVISAVKKAKFRFAGHIARTPGLDIVHRALKVRNLA